MKLARILFEGQPRIAVVRDETFVLLPAHIDGLEFLAMSSTEQATVVSDGFHLSDVASQTLLSPIDPRSMRDFMTFEQHLAGAIRWVNPTGSIAQEWYEAPCFYFTNHLAAVGAHEDVAFPPGCETLDFELELAVVLKKGGRNLTVEQAEDCIGGYTILNDWSARDIQSREMRIGLGPVKGKDFASTLGPWIVTPDELNTYVEDGVLAVDMAVSINGKVVGTDNSRHMAWTFAEMISYASRGSYVAVGDVLGSGTCGSGCLAELWGWAGKQDPPPLRPGDVIRMDIAGIGSIENRLVAGVPGHPIPRARNHSDIRLG